MLLNEELSMRGLKGFLVKHGITQAALAEAVGVSQPAVTFIVQGENNPSKTTIDAILRFCRTLDPEVTYELLFGESSEAA